MASRGGTSGKASLRLVAAACLALCLLLSRCSPCEGRKLLLAAADEEGGKKVLDVVEGDLVLGVPPASPITGSGKGGGRGSVVVEETPRGFLAGGRAARLMRSVPSPGVGH